VLVTVRRSGCALKRIQIMHRIVRGENGRGGLDLGYRKRKNEERKKRKWSEGPAQQTDGGGQEKEKFGQNLL